MVLFASVNSLFIYFPELALDSNGALHQINLNAS